MKVFLNQKGSWGKCRDCAGGQGIWGFCHGKPDEKEKRNMKWTLGL